MADRSLAILPGRVIQPMAADCESGASSLGTVWDKIESTVMRLFQLDDEHPADTWTVMELATCVYNFVNFRCDSAIRRTDINGDDQRTAFSRLLTEWLQDRVDRYLQKLVEEYRSRNGLDLLRGYVHDWKCFRYVLSVWRIATVSVRPSSFEKISTVGHNSPKTKPLGGFLEMDHIFLNLWREVVIFLSGKNVSLLCDYIFDEDSGDMLSQVVNACYDQIELARTNMSQDFRDCFAEIHSSFLLAGIGFDLFGKNVKLYDWAFKVELVRRVKLFYEGRSRRELDISSVGDYAIWAKDQLRLEAKLSEIYPDKATRAAVVDATYQSLVRDREMLLRIEFRKALQNSSCEVLASIYHLVDCEHLSVEIPDRYVAEVREAIEEELKTIIERSITTSAVDAQTFFFAVASVYHKWNDVTETTFANREGPRTALFQGLEAILGGKTLNTALDARVTAKMLAECFERLHLPDNDPARKKNQPVISADALVIAKTDGMTTEVFYRHLSSKSDFQNFYHRALARRYLDYDKLDMTMEKNAVELFKRETHPGYNHKITKERRIIKEGIRLASSFSSRGPSFRCEFVPRVMCAYTFPLNKKPISVILPEEVNHPLRCFEEFYRSVFPTRNLTWVHRYGWLEIQDNSRLERHCFKATVFQASLILHFNVQSSYTLDRLSTLTGLRLDQVAGAMTSLLKAGAFRLIGRAGATKQEAFREPSTVLQLDNV